MLNHFLFNSKFTLNKKGSVCFVTGNEASDLDSMASSVAYAYLLETMNNDDDIIYIPLMNIPREDFKLRTEAVYLFGEAGIQTDNLLFTDEINIEEIGKSGKLKFILVDHNRISKTFEKYSDLVIEVIDHHADENIYDESIKTIEPVGSTATLIAEKMIEKNNNIPDSNIALLLTGTILLDTVNFNPDAKRTTLKDRKMAELMLKNFSMDKDQLFEKLQFEKFNTSSLSTKDLLRKDYKEWVMGGKKCGFSSALLSVEKWLEKDSNIIDSSSGYCKSKNLDILFIMIAYTSPVFTRELILYSEESGLKDRIISYMQDKDLQLMEMTSASIPEDRRADFFSQGNAAYSRKKLQPVIQEFFESDRA